MRVACIGGGPAGLYFAISMKLRDPSHEVVVFERNRPDDTFGWGVVLSDEALGNLARNDPVSAARSARTSPTGTTSPSIQGRAHRLRRPRLLRHRPDEAAPTPAEPRPRARRRAALPERGRPAIERAPPTTTSSSPPTALNSRVRAAYADALQARHRRAQVQVRLARHPPEVRRRLHLHLRGDARTAGFGRTPTSSTPTPRPSSSSAPSRPGDDSASSA